MAHQIYGDDSYHSLVREKCCNYMESEADFFSQFVEGGREMFPFYLQAKRMDACWGDDPEIEVREFEHKKRRYTVQYQAWIETVFCLL